MLSIRAGEKDKPVSLLHLYEVFASKFTGKVPGALDSAGAFVQVGGAPGFQITETHTGLCVSSTDTSLCNLGETAASESCCEVPLYCYNVKALC